jgi:hypothetical protein
MEFRDRNIDAHSKTSDKALEIENMSPRRSSNEPRIEEEIKE